MIGVTNFTIVCEVQTPVVPDSVEVRLGPTATDTLTLDRLSEADLREIGQKWTEALVARAKELKAQRGKL